MSGNLFIEDVEIWNADQVLKKNCLLVENGITKKIGPRSDFTDAELSRVQERLKAPAGSVLMPAGVDEQVHLRTPGQPEKELPETGLKAAASGGIGAVLTMPNTKPTIDSVDVLRMAREQVAPAEKKFGVQVLFTACMTRAMQGQECVDFAALMKAGVRHFTDDGIGVAADGIMEKVFRLSHELGFVILQHAEVPGHGGVLAPSGVQRSLGVEPYSEMAEVDMVGRDLRLLEMYPKARYHVLHVSAAKTLDLVEVAKKMGLNVTCEATPHHLLLTGEDIKPGDTSYKMNPPLRSESDRQALIAGLRSGLVDFVATDHAPHEAKMKSDDFKRASFGTTGLETSLRCLLKLVNDKLLTPQRLVEVFSKRPAQFLGIDVEFGQIRAGKPLRAVLVGALTESRPIEAADLQSLSKNNCFLGRPLPGKILRFFGRN